MRTCPILLDLYDLGRYVSLLSRACCGRAEKEMTEHNSRPTPLAGGAAGLGLQLAVGMVVFAGAGYWLDRRRGGGIAFTLAGVGLGLFYIGYECWKLIRALNAEAAQQSDDAKKRK